MFKCRPACWSGGSETEGTDHREDGGPVASPPGVSAVLQPQRADALLAEKQVSGPDLWSAVPTGPDRLTELSG